MLCEVSGAANSMMRRWESVFREYPDILSDAENRASVERNNSEAERLPEKSGKIKWRKLL